MDIVPALRAQATEHGLHTILGGLADRAANEIEWSREALADQRSLVRQLDIALNGNGAARQASLCDIVAQIEDQRWRLVRA